MVSAPDIDDAVKAALDELVAVIGDVDRVVGIKAVRAAQDLVLIGAEVGVAQPERAVLFIRQAGIREQLLKYDEVNNEQREVIYQERRKVLDGDNMRDLILKMITDIVENAVDMSVSDDQTPDKWDLKELNNLLLPVIPLKPVIRMATAEDEAVETKNKNKEKEAFKICLEKILCSLLTLNEWNSCDNASVTNAIVMPIACASRLPKI